MLKLSKEQASFSIYQPGYNYILYERTDKSCEFYYNRTDEDRRGYFKHRFEKVNLLPDELFDV